MSHLTSETLNSIDISVIETPARIRTDYGDKETWQNLLSSIKEFGLIEPIILCQVDGRIELNAGGRRLRAMKEIGHKSLRHGREFIWLDEKNNDPYRRKAVELEENLRRKDLSWQEQVTGKEQLLKLMESIHGPAQMGRGQTGFGVVKLAAMLGETAQATSKDLKIANMVKAMPMLAKEASKAAVERKFIVLKTIAKLMNAGKSVDDSLATMQPVQKFAVIIECDNEQQQVDLLTRFTAEGLRCRALIS